MFNCENIGDNVGILNLKKKKKKNLICEEIGIFKISQICKMKEVLYRGN